MYKSIVKNINEEFIKTKIIRLLNENGITVDDLVELNEIQRKGLKIIDNSGMYDYKNDICIELLDKEGTYYVTTAKDSYALGCYKDKDVAEEEIEKLEEELKKEYEGKVIKYLDGIDRTLLSLGANDPLDNIGIKELINNGSVSYNLTEDSGITIFFELINKNLENFEFGDFEVKITKIEKF